MTTRETTALDLPSGLALIGGILMIISGVLAIFHMAILPLMGTMMGQWMAGASIFFGIFGIGCGAAVTIGAIMMSRRPANLRLWAFVVLVFSALSFIELGGFFIGAVLGIIGSIIALTTKR